MALQLLELREKIQTARNLQGVVETMRGLAAVNIRRAEAVADQAIEYARTIHFALRAAWREVRLSGEMDPSLRWGRPSDEDGPLTAVVVTTDQGLCGQFNDRIISYATELLRGGVAASHPSEGRAGPTSNDSSFSRHRQLLVVGHRGLERFQSMNEPVIGHVDAPSSVEVIPKLVRQTFLALQPVLTAKGGGRVIVVYNRLSTRATFEEYHRQLVPLDPTQWAEQTADDSPRRPLFTLPVPQLLPWLMREQLYIDLFQAFTQSFASENAARLASMQSASENIDERLMELEGEYRRVRQDVITAELMDLMGGVEAVQPKN